MKPRYKLTFPKFLIEGRLEATFTQLFDMVMSYRQMIFCGAEPEYIGTLEWDGIEWQKFDIKKTLDGLNRMLATKDEMVVTTNEWWNDDNTD